MHPALYTRASMIREIAAAVGFISKFLRTKGLMNERQLQTFSQSLQELLAGEGGAGAAGAAPPLRPGEPLCPFRRGAACPDRRRCGRHVRPRQRRAPRAAGEGGRGRAAPPRVGSRREGRCGGRAGLRGRGSPFPGDPRAEPAPRREGAAGAGCKQKGLGRRAGSPPLGSVDKAFGAARTWAPLQGLKPPGFLKEKRS